MDKSCVDRVQTLRTQKQQPDLRLRVIVEGGGCSGFQYRLDLTEARHDDDLEFSNTVVTDPVSLPFLTGATVKFEETLLGADFVIDNPNAVSGCGCGTSFSI